MKLKNKYKNLTLMRENAARHRQLAKKQIRATSTRTVRKI
jgi:hypothetical protein